MGGATRAARVFTLACAFVACARAVYGAATADVCVGVSWMARGALTPSRTVHPVTAFPSAHPTYVHAKQKACLGFTNSSEPEGAVGGVTLAREVSNYYSAASGACATTPALSAGAMFYNRAELTSTASYAESNTGIEKDKTVRIVLVSDDSKGAHIVVLAGASTTLSSSRPEVGLRMEGRSLQNVNNVFIEEPRGFGNQNTGGIGCDPTTSSTTDCYELDADLGVASFRWGSRSAQRGVVIGYIADVDEDVSLKFTMLERINAVEIGSFDKNTYGLTWETIPIANAMDGFRLRSATCANHCLSHSTCASCATDDACGYCAVDAKCKWTEGTCPSGFDRVGECLDTCGAATTCGACTDRPGCGWCHTTGRCTATTSDATAPQDGTCSAYSVGADAQCATCPGAINNVFLPSYVDVEPVWAFCNGRGTCDNVTLTCTCDDGYGGEACENMCPGGKSNPCSRKGVCESSTGECFCNPGYDGVRCQDTLASATTCACGSSHTVLKSDGSQTTVCSGRVDSGGACVCMEGWTGTNCDVPCAGALIVGTEVCGGHGTCDAATATCQCDSCYSKDATSGLCVQDACATCDSDRGTCTCVSGSMQCVCKGQFSGYSCNQCNCGNHGRCNSLTGECECADGYAGKLCDEIINPVPSCGANGNWSASLEMCVCSAGYVGTLCDYACSASTNCKGHGSCNADDGSCSCFEGYTGSDCGACATGYEPYPTCGKALADGECTDASTPYTGSVAVTISGQQCQAWSSQTPFAHPYASEPDLTSNYCGNPSSDAHPWCYVDYTNVSGYYTRGEARWEFCSVPECKSAYVAPQKVCGVFGAETVMPFTTANADGTIDAINAFDRITTGSTDVNCATTTQLGLTAHQDVVLHGDFVIRFNVSAAPDYVRRYISAVGLNAVGGSHSSVEVLSDRTVNVGGSAATLPYSDDPSVGTLCVSDWSDASSGLDSTYVLTITLANTTVVNITQTKPCATCAEQLLVIVSVPDTTTASGICSTASGATTVNFTTHETGTVPFTAAGNVTTYNAALTTACSYTRITTAPSTTEKLWCDQCQYLGEVYDSCVATMANDGYDFARASVVEFCRMAFVAIYGYDRTIATYLPTATVEIATLLDTIAPYAQYTSAETFRSFADNSRLYFDITDVAVTNFPKYIVGTALTTHSFTRYIGSGLPRTIEGETITPHAFPFPAVQDACRGSSDIGATSGYRVYTMDYFSTIDEWLKITMCGSTSGTIVGVYQEQYVEANSFTHNSPSPGDGKFTFVFTPFVDGDGVYEARFSYKLLSTNNDVMFSVTRSDGTTTTTLGTFEVTSTSGFTGGDIGFEFTVPYADPKADITIELTPTVEADSWNIEFKGVTVTAKNFVQEALGFPSYGGFSQITCAKFQASACGNLQFLATYGRYHIVVSGRDSVNGAYKMRIAKVRAELISVSTVSNNAATSLVRSASDASGVLTPYKLAKYGDHIRVVVRADHAIDSPIITLGSYTVPAGLILSAVGGTEWAADVIVSASMVTSGSISVSVTEASTLTMRSRGFDAVVNPIGSDVALVVLDITPVTITKSLVVNPSYALGFGAHTVPAACSDILTPESTAVDVNLTAAKYARTGEYVAILFTTDEQPAVVTGNIGGVAITRWSAADASMPAQVSLAVKEYKTLESPTYMEAVFALIDDATLGDGVLPFAITTTDAVGNVGATMTTAINALSGVTASSPLADRMRSARLLYDKSSARVADIVLSYADSDQMTANQGRKPSYYHSFSRVAAEAYEYRLGDTVTLLGTWTEYVTRPYGAYFRSSASSGVHVPQSGISYTAVGGQLTGKAECLKTEFRPRAQEARSEAQGFGGTNYEVSRFHKSWQVTATLTDPCDIVGKGALAWSARADCQAESFGGRAFWIPLWSAWCRHGWGTLGYSLVGAQDPAGNTAQTLRRVSKSPNNADALVTISDEAIADEVILRTPISLAGMTVPSWLNSVPRRDWTSDPNVIEVYIEPNVNRWNEYRRVVKLGDSLQIQFYTDQPVKGIKAQMVNGVNLPQATHSDVPSAMHVETPCANSPDMTTWLSARGLLALEAEEYNDGSVFAHDDDWFDWLMQTSYDYRQPVPDVPGYPDAYVLCKGFWVQRGLRPNGKSYSVRRLCPNRRYLRQSTFAATAPTCTDINDRIYTASDAFNYWVINFQFKAVHLIVDGPLSIQWQITTFDDRILPTSSTWTTSSAFFTAAALSTTSITGIDNLAHANTDATGPAFNASISCGRNVPTVWNAAGSSVWVSQDTTAPTLSSQTVYVSDSIGEVYSIVNNTYVALTGDYIKIVLTFDEHIAGGLYIELNGGVQTARATSVHLYDATFEFTVTQALADVDAALTFEVFGLSDIQDENKANTTGVQISAFGSTTVKLQKLSQVAAATGGAAPASCTVVSDNSVDTGHATDSNTVTITVTIPTPVAPDSPSISIVNSVIAGVVVTPNVAGSVITMSRAVSSTSSDFVDGSAIPWDLIAIAKTPCTAGSTSNCITRFELSTCVVGGTISQVIADFTSPSLVAVELVESVNQYKVLLADNTSAANVTITASEPLDSLTYTLSTSGSGCTITSLRTGTISLATDGLTGSHTTLAITSAELSNYTCILEVICVTFVGVDKVGKSITNPRTCRSFAPTYPTEYPGWLALHNAPLTATVDSVVPVGVHCLDSSVDKRACVAAVDSTPMEHGDFLRITASSSTPMAVKDIILNSTSISSLPYTEDAAWTSKCDDLVLDGFCLEVATRATCANYLCPTCAFANMCDFSCGFCDSRRGAATKHVIYVRTSDFANLATFTSGAVTVKMQGHPVLMPAALMQTSSDLVSYTARATDSCAGRCGGTAPSGCECNPTCKSRGTCCADAGHCCAVGTPSTGSLNVRGGCLRDNAVPLAVTAKSWGESSTGQKRDYVGRYSTIYIELTGNKPIDVRSVTIGGVTVDASNIAIEYASLTSARQFLNQALSAYAAGDDASFATNSLGFSNKMATLPAAAESWDGNQFSRQFPDIPSTLTATIRIDGFKLVPQNQGALAYTVVYYERSAAPYFTDGTAIPLTGTGPYWLNPPTIASISYALVANSTGCDLVTSPTPIDPESNGLTLISSNNTNNTLRTVVTFSHEVVVRKWTVEGAEVNCYGTCSMHGYCSVTPHILPPDEGDDAEYITTWTSCREFNAKELTALADLGCSLREFVNAVDLAENKVQGVRWNSSYCFSAPPPVTSNGIITIRGVTSCANSATNKTFGPGCTATIYIEADGEILEPTLQYWTTGDVYNDFPTGCVMSPSDPTSQSSSTWTMTCAGSAALLLPEDSTINDELRLKTSNIRDTAGNALPDIDATTTAGYRGSDVSPIIIDNTPPGTTTIDVPPACVLSIGDTTIITAVFDEASSRPTFYAFGAKVSVANVVSSTAALSGFHTTWKATVTTPSGWLGGAIMPWIVTNAEDDVGNVDATLYSNYASADTTVATSTNPSCTVDTMPPQLTSASCAAQVVKPGDNVTVTFVSDEVVRSPGAACVYISGVAATPTSSDNGTTWTATATIPADACDGEVSISICPLTDLSGNVGTTTVTRYFGATSTACLIDGTPPVLQLIDFVSDNPYDSKMATVGDNVTLYFEGSEMVNAPTFTVGGSPTTATPLTVSGVARRRFPFSTDALFSIVWTTEYTVTSSTAVGSLVWNATGFQDKAGNTGVKSDCADWNSYSCTLVYAYQAVTSRSVDPQIDFTGEVVQTFSNFLVTSPKGNFSSLRGCSATISTSTIASSTISSLRKSLELHDQVASAIYEHHLMTAQDWWWTRGGVCGAANGLMCRDTCGRCNDVAVVVYNTPADLTVANVTAGGTAVDGDTCDNYISDVCMCNPTLGKGSTAKFMVSTSTRDLVSKPTVTFTDSQGRSYTVPPANIVAVAPQTWPVLDDVPCLGTAGVRDGVCDADTRYNNRDGCWDGGDCCLDTCKQIFSDENLCLAQDCQDHALSPVTGRPAPGFWTTYNAKALIARELSVDWIVQFTVDDTLPFADGAITGSACCMQDKTGADVVTPLTPGQFTEGSPCLAATLQRDTTCLISAAMTADNGENVIKEAQALTLALTFSAKPKSVACTIAGVNVPVDTATSTDTALTFKFPSTTSSNAVIASRIATTEEQTLLNAINPDKYPLNLWPNCTRGLTIPFACSIVDCAGNPLEITDADDPTADVCFDYLQPDAVTISQESDNSCDTHYAKVGDVVTVDVAMNASVINPTTKTVAGEACTLVRVSDSSYTCSITVSSTTAEGETQFEFAGMTGSGAAYLDSVNSSYIELKSLNSNDEAVLGGTRVIIDRTPPVYETLQMLSIDSDSKLCARRCTARLFIDAIEELKSGSCTVTIGGLNATVSGTGEERVAEVNITETSGIVPGPIGFSVTCSDLACNSATNTTLVGFDIDPVIYSLDRTTPLEVLFYSDRPNHLELGNEDDCLKMEITFASDVFLKAVTMGAFTNKPVSSWSIVDINGGNVVQSTAYSYFLITECITDAWGTTDIDPVPWSFTYDDGTNGDVVWNTILTTDPDFPLKVRLDLEAPEATYIYAWTNGAFDPTAGIGDALYLDINATEPVFAPTVVLGDVMLNTTDIVQIGNAMRWRAGPYIISNTTDDDNVLADVNNCLLFTVTLKDLVDHTSPTYSSQINADGSDDCPTQRVIIDQHPPTVVWLQTEYVTSTTVDFTLAVDEHSNVSWIVLPRGSEEPTPQEVAIGTGSNGVGPVARGVLLYLGSSIPSPGASAGGKGQVFLNITGLSEGIDYDIWVVPFDAFGNYEPQAQSRWVRTVGIDMIRDPLLVQEGGYTSTVQVKLTQVPTADVTVRMAVQNIADESQISFAVQAINLNIFTTTVTLTFTPADWNVAQEVAVKAVDDKYVEDEHSAPIKFTVTSLDKRYDELAGPVRGVTINDNDECGIVVYDPDNQPTERTISCAANSVVALLNYTVAEDTTVYADVYLTTATRGDTVQVTLTSSDLTLLSAPNGAVLTFNETNYNLAQRVTITPVYSCVAALDRYVPITVTVDSSTSCGALAVPDIPVYISDTQTAGLMFSKKSITGVPGNTYQFDMWLTSQPAYDVRVALTTLKDVNGAWEHASASFDCGGEGPVWTFSAEDCQTPVTCIVTLVGDDTACGDVTLDMNADATSLDEVYNAIESLPPTLTVLEDANAAGWYIRDVTNTISLVLPPDAAAGTSPLAPWQVGEELETGVYTMTPTTALCKTVTIRPFIDSQYERYAIISPREITLAAGFSGSTTFRVRFPRNYNVHVPNQVIQIWHDVKYTTDDPDYLALSPNLGGSALPVEVVEYDVPGLDLGNAAKGTVLIDEPCSNSVTTQLSSLGFSLKSAPLADVVVTFGEMAYNTSMLTALGDAYKHLTLGTTSLTFTPNNWNLAQPVMVSALSYTNITASRTAYVCASMSSADDVYEALDDECYPVHICDCSDGCGVMTFYDVPSCVFTNAVVEHGNLPTKPQSFELYSSCWNVTITCGGLSLSSLTSHNFSEVMTNFTTLPDAVAYTDLEAIQRLRHSSGAWSVVDKTDYPLAWIDGGVQGETNEEGIYCLGVASSGLIVENPDNAGLFVEKSDALSLFANQFEINAAATNTFDTDVAAVEIKVLAGASPDTDSYNLTCVDTTKNFTSTDGCVLITDKLWGRYDGAGTMYFKSLGYYADPSDTSALLSGRRKLLGRNGRKLLQTGTPATSAEFMSTINSIAFSDISLDPTGSTRFYEVTITDSFGAVATGPVMAMDTEGVNDAPQIFVDLPTIYTEKESIPIGAPWAVVDVDNQYWRSCVVTISDVDGVFQDGDTLSYNSTAIVEQYVQYNTTMPANFTNIVAAFGDEQRSVTFTGEASWTAYLKAMQSIYLQNSGPAMTDTDRYIKMCCYDYGPENEEGCAVQRAIFQPVNDAPTSESLIFYIPDPRVAGLVNANLVGNDPDNDALEYVISCNTTKGELVYDKDTGVFSYTPNAENYGNDRFVYYTTDGVIGPEPRPLRSKYATVEIRLGNGDTAPVANDIYIDVREDTPQTFSFNATDEDSTDTAKLNDIYRYQIVTEPTMNVGGITLQDQVTIGGKRYTEKPVFTYTANANTDLANRVQELMTQDYGANFDFSTLSREEHPGFNLTYFSYVAIDLSGKVSNVAKAWILLRLKSETNTRPVAEDMAFSTTESTGIAADFATTDTETTLQLLHSIISTAVVPTLGTVSQTGVAANPYSRGFAYEPYPYYNGTDTFQYQASDPHGATSEIVTVTVTIDAVDQPPQGACGPNSTLKSSVDELVDFKGKAEDLQVLQGYQIVRARIQAYLDNPQRRDLEFYAYAPFIDDLNKFDDVVNRENVMISCGSAYDNTGKANVYHDEVAAVALLAYDVDQQQFGTIQYVLSELPSIASSDPARGAAGYAGTLHPYVAPAATTYNGTNLVTYSYSEATIAGLSANVLAVGDIIGDSANGPALLMFNPREFIYGEVTFKWYAQDTSVSPPARGEDVTMTVHVKCRGGERVNRDHGETCDLCPLGTFNSANVPDQQNCGSCPAGSYTSFLGSTVCIPCPADTYSDYAGAHVCTPCPVNKRSASGSDDESDCKCDIGFVRLSDGSCRPCSLDRQKCTEYGLHTPLPYEGYWQDPTNGARNLSCFPGVSCVEKFSEDEVRALTCAGPRFSSDTTPAYVADACTTCAKDHYRYASFCETCDPEPITRIFFIILGYSVALYVLFELSRHPVIPALTIMLSFFQVTAGMQYFEVPWPKVLARWMQVSSLSYADLQILGWECVTEFDYFTRFQVTMFAPFGWLFIIACAVVIRCWRDVAMQAVLGIKKRRLIERRRKLKEFDIDADKWTELAISRDGLPFDRPELRGKGDDFDMLERHMYGVTTNEGLRQRVYQESVEAMRKADRHDELKLHKKKSKKEAEYELTKEQLDDIENERRAATRIIKENIDKAVPSFIIAMWWGYMLLSRTVTEFFECKNNGESVRLTAAPEVECNAGRHLEMKPLALSALVLYPIGLIILVASWLYAHRASSKTRARVHVLATTASKIERDRALLIEKFEARYGMTYTSVRPAFYLWICVDLFKKLSITGVKVLFPEAVLLQSFAAIVIFTAITVACTRNPYVSTNLNVAELAGTGMNTITLIAGFYFQLGIMGDTSTSVATTVIMFGLIGVTLIQTFVVVLEFFPWMKKLMFLIKYRTQKDIYKPEKIGTHESGPQGTSLYVFRSDSPLRYWCWRAMRHPLFDKCVTVAVFLSLGVLIAENVTYEDAYVSDAYARVTAFNLAINAVFSFEALVKIISMGFILGEGAYLRDTFNCIDFLVIFLQFLLLIVDISSNVTGARSARFVRYIRFARIRYLRLFRRMFKFNALRGPNFRLMWLEARAEDTVEIAQAIERGRVVFEPATAETIEYTLRVLPPDVLRLACGLIDEMYNEMFDPALVAAYSQQTDAVHQTVQEANKDLVYEWLATVAEPGQKRVFMNTLTNIRNVGARLGAEGVAREMARQRYDSVEISNADAFVIPETDGGKDSAKAYKRRALRDAKSSSFASTKATISKQFDMFHTSLTNDDKVEDALNALPLLSVNEDEQMRELYKSKLALEQRLMVSDIEVDAPRAARAKAIKAEAAKAEAEAAAPAPARASWFGKK
uniref:Uncharacterized protein n=4 Tax=Ostreococcus mediterraneus TaxID=1486918 RepID=A0A7S0PRR7_9CHLO